MRISVEVGALGRSHGNSGDSNEADGVDEHVEVGLEKRNVVRYVEIDEILLDQPREE